MATIVYTARGADASRQSAAIAERALVDLERPYIIVEIIRSDLSVVRNGGAFTFGANELQHRCTNHGRSTAFLKEYQWNLTVLPNGQFPKPVPVVSTDTNMMPEGIVSAVNDPWIVQIYLTQHLDHDLTLEAGAFKKHSIYFVGYVKYTDASRIEYIHGFCLAFDPNSEGFVRRGDETYNYTKRIEKTPMA